MWLHIQPVKYTQMLEGQILPLVSRDGPVNSVGQLKIPPTAHQWKMKSMIIHAKRRKIAFVFQNATCVRKDFLNFFSSLCVNFNVSPLTIRISPQKETWIWIEVAQQLLCFLFCSQGCSCGSHQQVGESPLPLLMDKHWPGEHL